MKKEAFRAFREAFSSCFHRNVQNIIDGGRVCEAGDLAHKISAIATDEPGEMPREVNQPGEKPDINDGRVNVILVCNYIEAMQEKLFGAAKTEGQ